MKPLYELLDALGIRSLREELVPIYKNMTAETFEPISENEIIRLQERYGLLGDYLPQVLEGRRALDHDPDRKAWAAMASRFLAEYSISMVKKLPIPASDGSLAADMAPLFPLLSQVETAAQDYRDHGFTEEEIQQFLKCYGRGLSVPEDAYGHPGINTTYFHWIGRYAKASIFLCCGLNFEFCELPSYVRVLRNKKSGAIEILMRNLVFGSSGLPLESAGQTDPEGAFATALAVTPDAFYGFPVRSARCVNKLTAYPKDEWESCAAPGEMMFSVHIPRGADISSDAAKRAFSRALEIAREHYPERNIHGLLCQSWLLDPILETILPETSRIRAFGSLFERYPAKSKGESVFGFIFPKKVPYEELPENTSLERAIKKLYLDGKYVYDYGGFIPVDF